MNNKAKKLISGVLALCIGVSGNGIVGFADKTDTKSAEQTINSETNEAGTNFKQNLSAKDECSTPSTEQAKSKDPAAKEFKPEEITLSVEAAHNPYLEQAVKDLNEFIKEYNSKATREEKREFASLKLKMTSVRLTVFVEEVKRGVKGKFFENAKAELLKLSYIDCCVSENPYLADIMKEIVEVQKIYDSKLTNKAKRTLIKKEFDKLEQISGKEDNEARRLANYVKNAYLCCFASALDTKNKDKKSVWYKVQKAVDNTMLFAGKLFIFLEFLYPLVAKFSSSIFANIGNPILYILLDLSTGPVLLTLMYMTLFKPFDFVDACKKSRASLAKLF